MRGQKWRQMVLVILHTVLLATSSNKMGAMLRSDRMTYCALYLQPEAAFYVISHLGDMGCAQFIDMNPDLQAFQRKYVTEICRCAELERRLRFLESEMYPYNIKPKDVTEDPEPMTLKDVGQFEITLEKWETDLSEISQNDVTLMTSYLELTELNYVLNHIGPMLGEAEIWKNESEKKSRSAGATAAGDIGSGGRLILVTGVIKRSSSFAFEKMLWRISHGIIFYKQASEDKILIDPQTRLEIRKVAFLAVCQGEELSSRIDKICNGFRVNTYPCPNTYSERMDMMEKLDLRIGDLDQVWQPMIVKTLNFKLVLFGKRSGYILFACWYLLVLEKTRYLRCKALREISRHWQKWMIQVKKCKAIYYTMNHFNLDITKKCLIGECWIPDNDLKNVQKLLDDASVKFETNVESFMSKINTLEEPPTYHRTNKFTRGFQNLINAYGDSTYRELNPGLYTIITFPFLFAIMFADAGHGVILLIFAAWMCWNEVKFAKQKSDNEIWNIFFAGRYIILLMGVFSIYTGMIFNDIFAKSSMISLSSWIHPAPQKGLEAGEHVDIDPGDAIKSYFFGIDPIWTLTKNKIMFANSLKMKLSIIFGVCHMMFGIILSFFNCWYFKKTYGIFFEFLPEIIFLTALFFWLVVLIFYKWFKYGARKGHVNTELGSACAPQILILFIDMALLSETVPSVQGCKKGYMFENQRNVQTVLVLIAVLCVPVLLLGTPLYKVKTYKKHKSLAERRLNRFYTLKIQDDRREAQLKKNIAQYDTSFGELMIHQGVHTIEFVLSTISHTASYLRLWALSLAHTQLSEMLWEMILSKLALKDTSTMGPIKIYIIFAVWASFTISIMVVMEGLSAFLHTLRLHWVEFMSKFYMGTGHPFRPYSFKMMLAVTDKSAEAGCKLRNEPK